MTRLTVVFDTPALRAISFIDIMPHPRDKNIVEVGLKPTPTLYNKYFHLFCTGVILQLASSIDE
ncbi:MAG: hypothetical protein A2268_07920 [Candidatus Raymondbacteria bacterium RifOxyA12_full_50_37]|nr:MAG: hypothetical protein A2268_07920 [Candidatus Raymondbacteria bacterium RifOxyA12_full_50_37]OGJ98765.1 MAG: hypothetical protein A2453_09775 [Candidatus Raymondbacteria bacterium RIFOXYC2_FULL_50_21]OGK07089.1 MAG: hypothetical protein A2487_19685 [Candidatus Raymondbacteria bacterium RifOxyC12_full_50_8]